jgi:hypothetical protein
VIKQKRRTPGFESHNNTKVKSTVR